MRQQSKETLEVIAIGSSTVTLSWWLQHVSLFLSIVLTLVSIVWVSAQLAKFIVNWRKELREQEEETK